MLQGTGASGASLKEWRHYSEPGWLEGVHKGSCFWCCLSKHAFKPGMDQISTGLSWQLRSTLNCEASEESRHVLANMAICLQVSLVFCFQNTGPAPWAASRGLSHHCWAAPPWSDVAPWCNQIKFSLLRGTVQHAPTLHAVSPRTQTLTASVLCEKSL